MWAAILVTAAGCYLLKLAEHVPDMLRYRAHAQRADLVHWQWLSVEQIDAWLLPPKRPRAAGAPMPQQPAAAVDAVAA